MDPRISLAVAIFNYIFCLIGLSAQFLVCWTILRFKKSTFSNTFYTLAVALAVPDCVHLATQLCCALPAVFYGLEKTPAWFFNSCGYFDDVSYFAMTPLMLVIAFNRYMAVCHFETYKRFFNRKSIKFFIAFCYLFSFFLPSVMYGCKCYYDFRYAWLFACFDGGCADFALLFNSIIANSIVCGIVVTYVLIYFQYRRVRRRVAANSQESTSDRRRRMKESKLMFQFGMISSVLVGYQIFFWVFLKAAQSPFMEMLLNMFINLNCSISPFLYLTFGSEIRSRLPWKKPVAVVTTVVDEKGSRLPAITTNVTGHISNVNAEKDLASVS